MRGQVLLVLLLIMAVGLGVGLSIIQRSLSDISTSSKVEQSQRAFSAAEAGIEKTLQGTCTSDPCVNFSDNSASAKTQGGGLLPASGQALEYPPISKESLAQFWLADPNNPGTTTPSPAGSSYYTPTSLDVYWGDPTSPDKAAIELTFIYYDSTSGTYKNSKKFYDSDSTRVTQNKFTSVVCTGGNTTGVAGGVTFYCQQTVSSLPSNLKILRARLLYNSTSQPVAIKPVATGCSDGCSLPPQAKIILSTGSAGVAQRTIELFSIDKVVPPFFDYAVFSAGDINK